jgi:hypothetical protein
MRVGLLAAVITVSGCESEGAGAWTYRGLVVSAAEDGDLALSDSGQLQVLVLNRQDEMEVVCSLSYARAESSERIPTETVHNQCWSGVRLVTIGDVPHVVGLRDDDVWYTTRSDDGWSAPTNLTVGFETSQGRRVQAVELAKDADGRVFVVYASVPSDGSTPGEIRVSRLVEGALDGIPIGLPDSGGCCEPGPDDLDGLDARFDADGNLHVVAACGADLYWATDEGAAWSSVREPHEVPVHDPVLALGPDGAVHRAWTIGEWRPGNALDPKIAHSSRRNGAWSDATEAVALGEAPHLAITPDGTILLAHVTYRDYDNTSTVPRDWEPLLRCSRGDGRFETTSEQPRPEAIGAGRTSAMLVDPDTGAIHALILGWIATWQGRFDCPQP